MMTIFIIFVASLILTALPCAAQSDSFQRGYQQGYQAENPNSITPIAPIPSIPEMGSNYYEEGIKEGAEQGQEDNGTDYQSGVDEGVQQGEDNSADSDGDSDSGGGDDN